MNGDERHAEVIGELRGLGQKIDSHIVTSDKVDARQDAAISENRQSIGKLKDFQANTKGVALAVTIGATVLAAIGTAVAKVKDMF